VGRFDYTSGILIQTDLGAECYGSEPVHVADADGKGWLLVMVYNAEADRSELWILNAKTLGEPICCLALPSVVPLGFHGTWQGKEC
ncbi:MAG: carotenoid oxygenase family protein, partial [Cyanobacteria bacterium J06598_1]